MSDLSSPSFDDIAELFADYGTTLRGYVRYEVSRRNLKPFLKTKSLKVLDVGGGGGADAAWLAGLGHHVTLLEPSKEQRAYAQRRFNFLLSEDERRLIDVVPGTLSDLGAKKPQFDLILCHGVLEYQPRPRAFLSSISNILVPGGLLSLAEKGYYGSVLRAVREHDYVNLDMLRRSRRSISHLNLNVRAFLPDELERWLVADSLEVVQWTGLRVVSDSQYEPISDLDPKVLKTILDVEYEHGRNPALKAMGQLLHFIARKQ